MLVEQRDLEVLAQDVLQAFVLAKYPKEAEYLPVAWQLRESVDLQKLRHQDIQSLGLPFADHRGGSLILPIAMLALWAALLELNELDTPSPSEQAVRDALQRCCDALGTTTKLSGELLEIAGPMLDRGFADFAASAGARSPEAESIHGCDPTECVVVEWLKEDGTRSQEPERTQIAEAEKVLQTGHWDIVIKELRGENEVVINGEDPIELYPITPMRRGMLWLVLTKVGNCIQKNDIRELFGTVVGPESLQQYPSKLRDLLGMRLGRIVLPRAKSGQYPISRRGWSFLWIRRSANQKKSELLFDFH